VLARVAKMGDLFEPVWKLKQKLPQLTGLGVASEKGELEEQEHQRCCALRAGRRGKKKEDEGKPAAAKRPQVIIPAAMAQLTLALRMGLSDLEACFYPEKLREEISQLLCVEAECGQVTTLSANW